MAGWKNVFIIVRVVLNHLLIIRDVFESQRKQ